VYYCDIPRHDLETSRSNNRMRKNILEKRHCCTGNIILGLLFMLVMTCFEDYSGLMINLRLPQGFDTTMTLRRPGSISTLASAKRKLHLMLT
jgi:hypothetical protein